MEGLLIILVIILILAVCLLGKKLLSTRRSLEEISNEFKNLLDEDTNMQITIASPDKRVREFASNINKELSVLRKRSRMVANKSTEVQVAVTNIAHDIRTPVTAISGYLELLEEEGLEERAARYVSIIRERTESLKALTEELFEYSIIDATSDELNYENLTLNDELEVALAAAYRSFMDIGIAPEIAITDKKVIRSLDRKAVQRIFGNLLNNVVKYSDGDLTVKLDENGTITFVNSSAALTEIEAGLLFDRFYTVENARGSTGLGLSIAKLLTEKMGGKFSATYKDGKLSITVKF